MRQFRLVALTAFVPGVVLAASKLETTYTISSSSAESKTTITNASTEIEKRSKGYLFKTIRKALENTAYIQSIEETEGKTDKEESQFSNTINNKKTNHVFVTLALPAKVSLMFKVEQSYRECKPGTSSSSSPSYGFEDYGGSGSRAGSDCFASGSSVSVKGPVAVYGNYASNVQIEELMRDKQELNFELRQSYDKTKYELSSRFSINSIFFEENLYKFMEFFGVAPQDKSPLALTRQRLLLSVSRYLRQVNERTLQ